MLISFFLDIPLTGDHDALGLGQARAVHGFGTEAVIAFLLGRVGL